LFPWVLLVRDDGFMSTSMYIERALQKECNLISIRLSDETYSILRWAINKLREKTLDVLLNKIFQLEVKPPLPHVDLILVVDPVRRKLDFSHLDVKTAYYAIDTHTAFQEHIRFANVMDYDYVFVAQKDHVSKYVEAGCDKVYWLPLACDPEIHRRHLLPMKYDLSFVGKIWRNRERITKELGENFKMFVGRAYLHDMATIYSQSKMVLNISYRGDLNMRIFEVMSCGRLLLTNRIQNGLEELFKNGKHLVVYEDMKDLFEKIRYYLKEEKEREKIALSGQKEVRAKHTYRHRVKKILDLTVGR
jgi:spore maturation protein CgeB